MSFKTHIKPKEIDDLFENILISENKVSSKDFISKVKNYKSLDDALLELPDEYTEFYLKYMNNKSFNNLLKKEKLIEAEESKITVRVAPEHQKIKKIRYQGQFIILKYDKDTGWIPMISFRNITAALKYVKELFNDFI